MFYYAWINEVGIIDTRAASSINSIFNCANRLITVEKLILKEDGSQTLNSAFTKATQLKNIVIEGVIGNSINVSPCPLSKDSIISIINALSSTASGQIATFQTSAKEAAFTESEWETLTNTKSNWEFTLA